MTGSVNLEINDGVGTITFFHPQSNSLPGKVLKALDEEITKAGQEKDIKVIILKSEGERAFCAGASLDELIRIKTIEEGHTFFMGFANVINACRQCPKLIVGRIQGKAVGGGVGLASAVDYCLATKDAAVRLSELAVGIGPFVVGPAVERKIGLSAMSQMAMQPEVWYTANWAETNGLYAVVFESIEEMDKGVGKLTGNLSRYSPDAMRELKAIFWQGTEDWDRILEQRAQISGRLVLSDFTKTAIANFQNK